MSTESLAADAVERLGRGHGGYADCRPDLRAMLIHLDGIVVAGECRRLAVRVAELEALLVATDALILAAAKVPAGGPS